MLGDRIAIISEGHLRACGSSLFLKNRFGGGYRLTVLTVQPTIGEDDEDVDDTGPKAAGLSALPDLVPSEGGVGSSGGSSPSPTSSTASSDVSGKLKLPPLNSPGLSPCEWGRVAVGGVVARHRHELN